MYKKVSRKTTNTTRIGFGGARISVMLEMQDEHSNTIVLCKYNDEFVIVGFNKGEWKMMSSIPLEVLDEITKLKLLNCKETMNKWLKAHNVSDEGDRVFDGQGVVSDINYELGKIQIIPIDYTHNLGAGDGEAVIIQF